MGEIKDFIHLYISESGMIPQMLNDLSMDLEKNIKAELYPGHGWIAGDLHDSITAYVVSFDDHGGKIEAKAGSQLGYAEYVNDGHTLRNGEWWEGYHFMEAGLEKTVAMYR